MQLKTLIVISTLTQNFPKQFKTMENAVVDGLDY